MKELDPIPDDGAEGADDTCEENRTADSALLKEVVKNHDGKKWIAR